MALIVRKSRPLSVFGKYLRFAVPAVLGFIVALTGGCQEQAPVALDDQDVPGVPVSVTVEIPWSSFGPNVEVFGGYGSAEEIGSGVLA